MKKLFLLIALLLAVSISPKKIHAQVKTFESSAQLHSTLVNESESSDMRVVVLESIFKQYNSDLVGQGKYYVKYADENNIDWRLLPAIAGVESYFGTLYVEGSYNAYGWGGGYIYFDNWEDGIRTISKALKTNYYDRGATTVETIGPIYAEDPNWKFKVGNFVQIINKEYIRLTTLSFNPTL